MEEVLVPIFLFLVIGVVLGTWILTRHKERIAAIDKGLSSEEVKALFARQPAQAGGLGSLKWGLVFIFVGAAVLFGMYFRATYMVEESIYAGLIALFGGVGLVVFYLLARRQSKKQN